ncbi:hypothetical protein [Halovenus sp. HT40]|uniref:hypothetical protein n=1 Tax=Halovenus sp. HT40 TaxID=3126691 RepID=UPI00300E82AE
MEDDGGILAFDTLSEPPGIEIIDRLEQLRYQIQTPQPVFPELVSPEQFLFPVGKGLRITTEAVTLPNPASVIVRDTAGNMAAEVEHLDSRTLEPGSYILDLSTQIKTYMQVSGPVEITADLVEMQFEFSEPTTVDIGFRSRHTRPATTITAPPEPEGLMKAISHFGSALKSTSPEHSFPTLRGHPPRVELGDELHVPSSLAVPETGISLVVPPMLEYVYPVAPLAYYLGARVVPGDQPALRTETGIVQQFDAAAFEGQIERTLKQVFFLDCLTRTEGFYDVSLHERRVLDETLDLDWASLYDQPIGQRLETYLRVSYDSIADQIPTWRFLAHVEPVAESIQQIPFVVDDLAVIRAADSPTPAEPAVAADNSRSARGSEALTRSASPEPDIRSSPTQDSTPEQPYIQFEPTDALEQGWIGDGVPIGANKLLTEAFQNRFDREVGAGDISITIIQNDTRMDEERDLVDAAYGQRSDLPFDVTVHRNLSVDELHEVLETDCDFLHYIGHADADGFECPDGKLDADDLASTSVDAFLLNACSSYHQGVNLIEAGAIGGIVTLTDIISNEAVSIGELIAKLLNTGFPLGVALSIAREESILGGQYIVVGDGTATVTQSSSRTPNLLEIHPQGNKYSIKMNTYPTNNADLGTMTAPLLVGDDRYYLSSGPLNTFTAPIDQVMKFLNAEGVPVRLNSDQIIWSDSVTERDLKFD